MAEVVKLRDLLRSVFAMGVVLVVVALAYLAWAGVREYERRQGLYWYDVERDYHYDFDPEAVTRLPVELDADGLRWPSEVRACETAMLSVRVSSDWTGRWFEPEVRLEAAKVEAFSQFFERGARGRRYLNLSPLCAAGVTAGERVAIVARHASIESDSSELLLFRSVVTESDRLLVLAPHPDDAEIAAFGIYRSHQSTVVTVTIGDYANAAYGRLAEDRESSVELLGRLRAWDSVAVPIWGGVPPERSVLLGYLHGTLSDMYASPDVEAGRERGGNEAVRRHRELNSSTLIRPGATSTWQSLVADLVAVIERVQPDLIAAPHPILDGSTDHRLTTLALLQALAVLGDDRATLLLYDNHHLFSEYWPYGPADSWITLPPWFGGATPQSFGSLHSQPLDGGAQLDKLFALDAMHDLRAPPRAELGDPTRRMLGWFRGTARDMWQDPHRYYSYYRRAPRPNELFFVIEPEDRQTLAMDAAQALDTR